MSISIHEFEKSLSDSGLVALQELVQIRRTAPFENAHQLARELIDRNKLTRYQAFIALRGSPEKLVLGKYVILDEIGKGGMGEVYKARHRRMNRVVAIKMLPDQAFSSPNAVKRFEREAQAAAQLTHPNIVAAYDADEVEGRSFLVMEYIEGSDLNSLVIKDGPLAIERAVDYVSQAARGLQFAHDKGIVHRDVKPSNMMLSNDDHVKILDLGLARLREGAALSAHSALTNSDVVIGTFDYMAPEQASNPKQVDGRADIYGLACSLYFLLVGRVVFSGDSLMEKLIAHKERPIPRLRDAQPDVPERLDVIFRRMMAKDPNRRYATMLDVCNELDALKTQFPVRRKKAPPIDAGKEDNVANSIGMRFGEIKAGEFLMGADLAEEGYGLERTSHPKHRVQLSKNFLLSVYPVTQEQYLSVMEMNPSGHPDEWSCPVENVSWFDAIKFANRLSAMESLAPYYEMNERLVTIAGGNGYRLPTEAEWEYACRAGSDSNWYFGDERRKLELCAWVNTNSGGRPHSVGKKIPNCWGLYDMCGNVWEWCWDWFDELYYSHSPSDDPHGPDVGIHRVIRGGSFEHGRWMSRSASRTGVAPDEPSSNIGIRIARFAD